MIYGAEPHDFGRIDLESDEEMMLYQYLPICIDNTICIPERLRWIEPLLEHVQIGYGDYVYLTAKRLYATPENKGNRGGWHSDGFMTNDVNYIWYDSMPTEFAVQKFSLLLSI